MTRPRSAAGIVSFDGHIYAIGGHDGLSIFDTVSLYHHSTVATAITAITILNVISGRKLQ